MASGPLISFEKIVSATRDNPSMRDVLTQLAQAAQQQQAVTGTTPQAGATSGKTNKNARIPAQATGTVSVLNGVYVVELVNPGGTSPLSKLQAQQQAGSADALTSLQPVTPIYHQIRASTSPAFNVNSNTQTFGGDTGQVQTYWNLNGLGKGTWYIQFRSTYDGVNWNNWRNANGGAALGGIVNQVTLENPGNSDWILFALPGGLTMGIGAGVIHDQSVFDLATEVYSSGMISIAGPNGYDPNGNGVNGVNECNVTLEVPTTPAAGIPDYPVQIQMRYNSAVGSYTSPGTANVWALAFDPTNPNVKLYPGPNANWAVIRLPGGARIAIGQGTNNDGATIWTPGLSWMSGVRSMGIAAMTGSTGGIGVIAGMQTGLTGFSLTAKYVFPSGGGTAAGEANWFCIAWEAGAPVQTVGGANFLTIALQGGHEVLIGCGTTASEGVIALPAGFTPEGYLTIGVPASTTATVNHLRGVQECAVFNRVPQLVYSDNSNTWDGNVGWLMATWK